MSKILTTQQLYQADEFTIKNQNISSTDLMERAATKCYRWIKKRVYKKRTIHVFCGSGNNGGDGLVIARKLVGKGYAVKTYIIPFGKHQSKDFAINLERLEDLGEHPQVIKSLADFPRIKKSEIIIDAIFGLGLSRSPAGLFKAVIQSMNNSKATIISIDFPSGLFANQSVDNKDAVVCAHYTLTFQVVKLAFLLPENEKFVGKWKILDIGLDQKFIQSLATDYYFTSKKEIKKMYRPRAKFSHKGTFGHALIVGGSYGKIGAVVLASKAALRVGSGLVTAYIPSCGYEIVQTAIPEVMVEVDGEKYTTDFNYQVHPTVLGIGPGLGMNEETVKGFVHFLEKNQEPLVVDADAINIISNNKRLLNQLPKNAILTPHPKEFERLVGAWKNDFEKIEKLKQLTLELPLVVVLKGAHTAIAFQGKIFFNSTGNPALATAGSGDVLTGIITGLRAQSYSALEAAQLGVYLHGLTANLAMKNQTQETFIASDCIDFLGEAFKKIS